MTYPMDIMSRIFVFPSLVPSREVREGTGMESGTRRYVRILEVDVEGQTRLPLEVYRKAELELRSAEVGDGVVSISKTFVVASKACGVLALSSLNGEVNNGLVVLHKDFI